MYALHVGLLVTHKAQERMTRALKDMPEVREVFVDGDSFREWGEYPGNIPYFHGIIYFEDDEVYVRVTGSDIFKKLIKSDVWEVSLLANCAPHREPSHQPFSITDAEDWSIVYL